MKVKQQRRIIVSVLGVALLALGIIGLAFGARSVAAQAGGRNSGSALPFAHMGGFGRGDASGMGRRGGIVDRATLEQAIADALGMTVEELEAAYADGMRWPELAAERGIDTDVVHEAIYNATVAGLNAAVTDGTITQAEADAALARAELRYLAQIVVDRAVVEQAVADTLGISVEELQAARESGTRISELAEAAGVTLEDVQAAAQTARDAQIDQAVTDGVLTAEQAEQLKAMPQGCHGDFGGRGHGRGHGRGGFGGNRPDGGIGGRGGFGPLFGDGNDA